MRYTNYIFSKFTKTSSCIKFQDSVVLLVGVVGLLRANYSSVAAQRGAQRGAQPQRPAMQRIAT